jgi:hypothetical protein
MIQGKFPTLEPNRWKASGDESGGQWDDQSLKIYRPMQEKAG